MITVICCICKRLMGVKQGHGKDAISHGICEHCLPQYEVELEVELEVEEVVKLEVLHRKDNGLS